jgi:hypothetical protein
MKKLLTLVFFLLLLGFSRSTYADIVRQNSVTTTTAAATSNVVNLGFTASAGDTLYINFGFRSLTATSSVTVPGGATVATVFGNASASAGQSSQGLYYALNIPANVTSVTIGSSASVEKAISIIDYSGVANVGQPDQSGCQQNAAGTTSKGKLLITTNANDVILNSITNSANAGTQIASAGPVNQIGSTATWSSVSNISNNGGTNGSIGIAVAEDIENITLHAGAQWTTNSAASTGCGLALEAAVAASTAPPPIRYSFNGYIQFNGNFIFQ